MHSRDLGLDFNGWVDTATIQCYSPGSIADAMTPSLQLLLEGDVARLEFETSDSSSSEVLTALDDDDFDFLVMPFRMAVTARVSIFISSQLSFFKV